jgi:hypothetical protein
MAESSLSGMGLVTDDATDTSQLAAKLNALEQKAKNGQLSNKLTSKVNEVESELNVRSQVNTRDLDVASTEAMVRGTYRKVVTSVMTAANEVGSLEVIQMTESDVVGISSMAVELVLDTATTLQSVATFVGDDVSDVLGFVMPMVVNGVTDLVNTVEGVASGVVSYAQGILSVAMPEVGSVLVGTGTFLSGVGQ